MTSKSTCSKNKENKKFDINQTDFLITLMNLEINNLIKEELGQISLK